MLAQFLFPFFLSLVLTPMIILWAKKMNIMDRPNARKVHDRDKPVLGGLAIYGSFLAAVFFFEPIHRIHSALLIGSFLIVLIGMIDDVFEVEPVVKLIGQIFATTIVIFIGNIHVDFVNLPFGGRVYFGLFSIPITYLWMLGITNAMNFIDGLDGLAAGISVIALISISGMAFMMNDQYVFIIAVLLIGSVLGFLPYNFYPAKIFMGDTGALFLGFIIAALSLLGFKNITFISFIVPILILGVPISDTFFAIIRRIVNKRPMSKPDQSHLHHRLIQIGFTHLEAVILMYGLSLMFALFAYIYSMTTVVGSIVLLLMVLLCLELLVEKIGLVHHRYKPLLKFVNNVRLNRQKNK